MTNECIDQQSASKVELQYEKGEEGQSVCSMQNSAYKGQSAKE